jgi:hypothetical protein
VQFGLGLQLYNNDFLTLNINNMNVITIEDEAFYSLINTVLRHVDKKIGTKEKWVSAVEAMRMLGIKSKTTLQRYRDEGRLRFSQPDRKIILYDIDSIFEFLDRSAQNQF